MSFNRLRYDQAAYRHHLAETIGPGVYVTAPPRPDCAGECASDDPYVRLQKPCDAGRVVDVGSDLERLPWPATKCPELQYLPGRGIADPQCSRSGRGRCMPSVEDTRISNPPCTLRGTGWNRFDPLQWDPQAGALEPWARARDGVSYRIVAKDNHRPCLPSAADLARASGAGGADAGIQGIQGIPGGGAPGARGFPQGDGLPAYTWADCRTIRAL